MGCNDVMFVYACYTCRASAIAVRSVSERVYVQQVKSAWSKGSPVWGPGEWKRGGGLTPIAIGDCCATFSSHHTQPSLQIIAASAPMDPLAVLKVITLKSRS